MLASLQLLVATIALVAGSLHVAAWIESRSLVRRLLVVGVLVPTQITAIVLVLGGVMATFRPIPLLLTALLVGGLEVALLRDRVTWDGPMSVVGGLRRTVGGLRRHPLVAATVAVAAALTGWQTVLAVRIPDTSWDSLAYHLPEPSTWVLTGQLGRSGLSQVGEGYPMAHELLNGWTMVFLHSIHGTGLVPLWMAVVGGLAVFRLARSLGATVASAALGAALLLAMPAVALQIATGYVDVGAAALGLAAVVLALDARRAEHPFPLLLVAAAAAGLSTGAKASMAPVLLAVAGVAVVVSWPHLRARRVGPVVGAWVAGAATVGLGTIWYVVNLIQHGNPFYPVSTMGFEGEASFEELVRNQQAPPELYGENVPLQLWRTWTADLHRQPYDIDQRMGGLGAVWLLCLPALVWLGLRLWRRDRVALAVLAWAGVATWVVSGSMWWSRYTLVLAGIGCAALALARDALRPAPAPRSEPRLAPSGLRRLVAPALGVVVVALVGFNAVAAVSPAHEYALEQTIPFTRMGTGELAGIVRRGSGDTELRPWVAFLGLREVEPGTIAFVGVPATFPQVIIGHDLDHRVVAIDPPESPEALLAALREHDVRYFLHSGAAPPGSLEALAVSDGLHYRPVTTQGLITGSTLFEVGTFDQCGSSEADLDVSLPDGRAVVSGRLADDCGAIEGAAVEVWRAGSPDDTWKGAARIETTTANDDGAFMVEVPRARVLDGERVFIRFAGRSDAEGYRLPLASAPQTAPAPT